MGAHAQPTTACGKTLGLRARGVKFGPGRSPQRVPEERAARVQEGRKIGLEAVFLTRARTG